MQGLIDRYDLVATRDRVVGKRNDHLGARRQREGSLLHAWAGRPGQDHRIALCPYGRASAARSCSGSRCAESLPAAPEFNGQAMVDKVLSELAGGWAPCCRGTICGNADSSIAPRCQS